MKPVKLKLYPVNELHTNTGMMKINGTIPLKPKYI